MSAPPKKTRGLGRGLSALMADVGPVDGATTTSAPPRSADRRLPVEVLEPNPDQPRRDFAPEQLDSLAASIREKGVIQPLIVRPLPGDPERFQIVAGERRWRAAQMAQVHELPVLVRDFSDAEVLEIAIIENIQRADLNAVEEALGYKQLIDRFGHTQEKVAEALGKSRSHIANMLRLLSLPDEVLRFVRDGKLSAGHARALITLPNALELAREAVMKGLSVREVEKLARGAAGKTGGGTGGSAGIGKPRGGAPAKDADTRQLEGDLSATIGMLVEIRHTTAGSGEVVISYRDLAQLDELCARLTGTA